MDSSSFTGQVFTTLLALVFVGALAWVSLSTLKRLQQGRGAKAGSAARNQVRFVHALAVGPKERVVVVSYAGEEWLLGVAAGSITLLGRHSVENASANETNAATSTRQTPS